jgi:two-component system, chemotaxis family, protein-glutamate methylesterase/glutaminase
MIRVLIVEDSLSVGMLLQQILESDPQIRVAGMVGSGEAALRFLEKNGDQVHVVTMDIVMPGMDGFTATRRIMESTPLPIVIVSSAYKSSEAETSFKAVEAGAVSIIEKPVALTHPDYPDIAARMIETVKIMSEVKVVRRWARNRERVASGKKAKIPGNLQIMKRVKGMEVVVMGSSTGGPPVLHTILSILSREIHEFPIPILIVQHISPGFVEGMARWLQQESGLPIHIPKTPGVYLPGHVYLAPDAYHMGIGPGHRIILEQSPEENGQRPSVSYLFRSAASHYPAACIGVLLTGMGNDGAAELNMIKENGSLTMVQDEESSVVFGMPGEAVKIDAAHFILPPTQIAAEIVKIVQARFPAREANKRRE